VFRPLFLLTIFGVVSALAQIVPTQSTISAHSTSTQTVYVPASSTPTLFNLTVDSGSSGGDLIDVLTTNPAVLISLITPAGVEMNANNASNYGFTISTYTSDGSSDSPNPLVSAGTHTLIQFPTSQSSGSYKIKADSSAAGSDDVMTFQYYSSSDVVIGALTDSTSYRLGDNVIGSVLLFDGAPIQGATITGEVTARIAIPASLGGFQLVSQQTASSTTTLYTYTAQITDRGADAADVTADVSSTDPTIVVQGPLAFGDVSAGSTVTSLNTFSVEVPNSATLDPSTLTSDVRASTTPIAVTFVDSGANEPPPETAFIPAHLHCPCQAITQS
jgi:hypothetical protein